MKTRLCLSVLSLVALAVMPARGDVTIVNEDFESYANTSALQGQWVPSGSPDNGILNTDPFSALPEAAFPNGGQGVDHIGGNAMVWNTPFDDDGILNPTPTQSIVVEGDIFDIAASNNKRMSIGLRSNAPANLLEMGFYNATTGTPYEGLVNDLGVPLVPGFAFRAVLFGVTGGNTSPNWQFFEFEQSVIDFLERPDDADTILNPGDVGEAWHHYKATITPDSITYQLDLYRDGVLNDGTGTPGWDSTMVVDTVFPTEAGFDSLRIGGPSGITSPNPAAFDNISLSVIDIVAANTADFNGDQVIDAADYTVWRDNLGLASGATQNTGDANGDGAVDALDYDAWKTTFGDTVPAALLAAPTAVPEPSALLLVGGLLLGAVALRRG